MEFVLTPDAYGSGLHWGPVRADPSASVLRGSTSRLLNFLETSLGLSGPVIDPNLRAARLVPSLQAADGFFSASADVDPLGTALRLIEWRDTLWMQGWRAEPSSSRLSQLAMATVEVDEGVPDRLLAVEAALREQSSALDRIALTEPRPTLPWLWREVLTALEGQGTVVVHHEPAPLDTMNDIRRALHGDAALGDGSLQLFRPSGPRQAADAVAAWLAAQEDWAGTVIIGGDAVLDHALRRHGMPVTGAAEPGDQPLTQALRLSLAVGWSPPDPQRVFELLTLRDGPVPALVARRLLGALQEWPAVGSPRWEGALTEALERTESADRREHLHERLSTLFECFEGDAYPVDLARRKASMLARWASGQRETLAAGSLSQICSRFSALLGTVATKKLSASELEQLLMPAEGFAWSRPTWRAEAGLVAIDQPGALLGPANRVIWWSFSREQVPKVRPELPLYAEEFEALAQQGVKLQQPLDRAARQAVWWRRPLQQTANQLLLVCPEHGDDGTHLHEHPLWDELTCRASASEVARLVATAPSMGTPTPLSPREVLEMPRPRRTWALGQGIALQREGKESPSSLETLLGCNLAYALRYLFRVRPSRVHSLAEGPRLLGNLAHQLLGDLFAAEGRASAEERAALVSEMFDEAGPKLAASLFRPGADAERGKVRGIIARAAASIARWLDENQLSVLATEVLGQTSIAEHEVEGRADMVVGRSGDEAIAAVVDLKWGSTARHRAALEGGVAVQLLAYAKAFQAGPLPDIGYFILSSATMLAGRESEVFRAYLDLPDTDEALVAFEHGVAEAFARIQRGELEAPGNPNAKGERVEVSERTDNRVILAPKCGFCDFASLCGHRFEGER